MKVSTVALTTSVVTTAVARNVSVACANELFWAKPHTSSVARHLSATLSQFRPNSTAAIVQIDPFTVKKEDMSRTNDRKGGTVPDTVTDVSSR